MRVLTAVGASPPLATIVPALFASCPSLSMASINAWGGRPELSDDLTIIMNRIVTSPFFWFEANSAFKAAARRNDYN